MTDRAQAWLVLYGDGNRSVFVDQATAERDAARIEALQREQERAR